MSNEELVALIKAGRSELVEQLLKQNHGFLTVMANRHYSFVMRDRGCGDFSDLLQAVALGMINAIPEWDPERGGFLTFAKFSVLREIRALLGLSTTKQRIENVTPPVSLYAAVSDDNDTQLVETIADDSAINPCEAAVEALTHQLLRAAIDGLPKPQRTLMTRCALGGESFQTCADGMGVTLDECHRLREKAFRALRRDKKLARLREEYESPAFHHKGIASFRSSRSSTVEDAAIRREQLLVRIDETLLALRGRDTTELLEQRERLLGKC